MSKANGVPTLFLLSSLALGCGGSGLTSSGPGGSTGAGQGGTDRPFLTDKGAQSVADGTTRQLALLQATTSVLLDALAVQVWSVLLVRSHDVVCQPVLEKSHHFKGQSGGRAGLVPLLNVCHLLA